MTTQDQMLARLLPSAFFQISVSVLAMRDAVDYDQLIGIIHRIKYPELTDPDTPIDVSTF